MTKTAKHIYASDLQTIAGLAYDWTALAGKSILISGATGMIGTCLIDLLMLRNLSQQQNCRIYALGRSETKGQATFSAYWDHPLFHFIEQDIKEPLALSLTEPLDYILHLASTTHPLDYAALPIDTVTANIFGTQSLLELAAQQPACRFMLASTVEIYGENRGDKDFFEETDCGYIDCNTLRAGYPESKRAAEALCQAYRTQKGVDVVIPRLSRVYGPTMLASDSKALSQFIRKAVSREAIVLKSEGHQLFSYTYVLDAVSALLFILIAGESGQAYNIASDHVTLWELAASLAEQAGVGLTFALPSEQERQGYSTASKALLDTGKLNRLGWQPQFDLAAGLAHTLTALSSVFR